MLLAYVFALIVGLGVLLIQAAFGGKDVEGGAEADADTDADADADAEGEADAGHDLGHGVGHGGAPHGGDHEVALDAGGLVALFVSTRFWIFTLLGFGLSGTILTLFGTLATLLVLPIAAGAGLASGLGAAYAFRALRRSSGRTTEDVASAVGRVARVVVPAAPGRLGRVRIEIGGQTVDLVARAEGEALERGEEVVIEEVEGETAQVSRVPPELREP
ncbi:MAG: hypothetical protein HY908_00105 [Myxococcales bacterium]|nr:hypothetical protein [Myxococcales bacterium]